MKWFKHESTANMDAKLQEVLLDYGLEGYGLYWYCLELIAGNVEAHNLTFELEHDARIIARNTGSTVQKVEEMMNKFSSLGLFENSGGTITCLKLASVSDDYTSKMVRIKGTQALDSKRVLQTPRNSEKVPLDKTKLDKTKLNKEKEVISEPTVNQLRPHLVDVFEFWKNTMEKTGATKLDSKRKSKIEQRLRDGYTVDQIKQAIINCSKTPHNMGQNDRGQKYNDIELICRDAANLERFIESKPETAGQQLAVHQPTQSLDDVLNRAF